MELVAAASGHALDLIGGGAVLLIVGEIEHGLEAPFLQQGRDPRQVAAVGLKPPTLVIVGDVVSLAETLSAAIPAAEAVSDYSLAAD